jgi:hypothetical protein
MVVSLQEQALLAFGEDDQGVDNLVEFREVEKPAIEG